MIYSSYLQVRERTTGGVKRLAEANHLTPGGPSAQVSDLHETLRQGGSEGDRMREQYSHAVYVVDNVVRHHYVFPDPAIAQREQKLMCLAEAKRILRESEAAVSANHTAAANLVTTQKRRDEAAASVAALEEELTAPTPATSQPTQE